MLAIKAHEIKLTTQQRLCPQHDLVTLVSAHCPADEDDRQARSKVFKLIPFDTFVLGIVNDPFSALCVGPGEQPKMIGSEWS